jgi:hypothetical protein
MYKILFCASKGTSLSGVYTGKKTLHVVAVAVASDGNLKRWEDFY